MATLEMAGRLLQSLWLLTPTCMLADSYQQPQSPLFMATLPEQYLTGTQNSPGTAMHNAAMTTTQISLAEQFNHGLHCSPHPLFGSASRTNGGRTIYTLHNQTSPLQRHRKRLYSLHFSLNKASLTWHDVMQLPCMQNLATLPTSSLNYAAPSCYQLFLKVMCAMDTTLGPPERHHYGSIVTCKTKLPFLAKCLPKFLALIMQDMAIQALHNYYALPSMLQFTPKSYLKFPIHEPPQYSATMSD